MKTQKLNRRQARWALYLFQFDFTLKYVLGTRMGQVDRLSRRPDWKVGIDGDNKNQVVVKDSWLRRLKEVIIEGPKERVLKRIKKAGNKDEDVIRIVEEMKKVKVKELWENKWQMEGELVLKEGKMYVPKDEELRAEVIWLHHDVPATEHSRKWKTVELVTRNYWWLGVMRDVGSSH